MSSSLSRQNRRSFLFGAVIGSLMTIGGLRLAQWIHGRRRSSEARKQEEEGSDGSMDSLTPDDVSELLDFLLIAGKLKNLPRTGWVDRGVRDPESVSDHMYRMAVMAMVLAPFAAASSDAADTEETEEKTETRPSVKGLDIARMVQIALLHDLAEAEVGDITPEAFSGVSKEEKTKMETKAIQEIVLKLPSGSLREKILGFWMEFEHTTSREAALLHELDKLEMLVQAFEYETAQEKELQSFYDYVEKRGGFAFPITRALAEEIERRRRARGRVPPADAIEGRSEGEGDGEGDGE